MTATPQERIAYLLPQVEEAKAHLYALDGELRQARLDAAPFRVGEVVEAEREVPRRPGERRIGARKEWQPAIIRRVENLWSGTPSYRVSWRRKDGSWAAQVSYPYGDIRKAPARPEPEPELGQ